MLTYAVSFRIPVLPTSLVPRLLRAPARKTRDSLGMRPFERGQSRQTLLGSTICWNVLDCGFWNLESHTRMCSVGPARAGLGQGRARVDQAMPTSAKTAVLEYTAPRILIKYARTRQRAGQRVRQGLGHG